MDSAESKASDCRITKVVARHLQMRLPHPYAIASGVMYHADTVVIEIIATDKILGKEVYVGYGEGAPHRSFSEKELVPDILHYIESTAGPQMLQKDPVALLLLDKFTTNPDPDHIVALGAIDIALWDLYGKITGKPICDLLGRVREGGDVLWPVSSANSLQDDIKALKEKVDKGFHSFMIKCGSHPDVQTDIDRVLGLLQHKFVHPIELIPDANQGWNLEDATKFVQAIIKAKENSNLPNRVAFLEQPLHRNSQVQNMLELQKEAHRQLFFSADESIRTLEDLHTICENKHFQVGSIKVCKVGGITGAMQACHILADGGIRLYFNSMIEGSCAQAALLHVYCATREAVLTDLGHAFMSVLRLEEYADFYKCLSTDKSKVRVALEKPGLGLQMNVAKMDEQTRQKIQLVAEPIHF